MRPVVAAAGPAESSLAFRVTLAGTFVTALGQGLTAPFLFVYFSQVLGASLTMVGLIVAISSLIGLLATGVGGNIGDRIGLGRLAGTGLAVQACGTGLLAVATTPALAALGVVGTSVGNALAWPNLNALVHYQVPVERRPRAFALRFGVLNAGIGLGSLLAGALVSVRNPTSFHLVYAADGATTLVFAALVFIGLRGRAGWGPRPVEPRTGGRPGYAEALHDRPFLGYLAVALALGIFGYAQFAGPWAEYVTQFTDGSTRIVGAAFAANTFAIVVLQLPVERLTRTSRRSRLLVYTAICWAAAWAITAVSSLDAFHGAAAAGALVVALVVFGLGETLYSPVSGSLPNGLAPDHLRARYNSLSSATWPFGGFVGAPLAGALLGGGTHYLWPAVVVLGLVLAAFGALVLGRMLPTGAEQPPTLTAEQSSV